ncbi:His-Xaa-Ser system radical SAM maturase HxsB [Anaerostipes amylophilus]|nr:His-Xaa-Ser system radical SAM maturase HxsB [Anaerostipes amylophilus]MCU6781169.1 His-Xaa-Ser system radical SAM maturase HxsB [Anaerostipes amylophilus]CUN90616.1 Anaerobic sulfatase-maturating enzyme [Anaerostipes hadrus]
MKNNYFNFKQWKDKMLLTNEQGRYILLGKRDFLNLVNKRYDLLSKEILQTLKDRFFIYDIDEDVFIEKVANAYRDNKQYLFSATSLHIFVMTNACNMCCVYCQAQDSAQEKKGKMQEMTAKAAVDIALQSPNEYLTFEFQGGEPLLNFETIKYIVEYSEQNKNHKQIQYSLVTNTLLLNEEMIQFFKKYDVSISTSLDGCKEVHNSNRPKIDGDGTYDYVSRNIKWLQSNDIQVGAIETTTKISLKNAEKIIETYHNLGLNHLFIRPLTPLGYAKEHWAEIGYEPEEFLKFYKQCILILLEHNRNGIRMSEGHARIFLKKILTGYSENYMELRSPCGAGIGQMAYYYDGNIYTCDEGRMVAEMGDQMFHLGNVNYSTYDDLMENRVCKVTCQASVLESLPGCCDCVYHPYCGVCPVISYASDNSIYARESNVYRCKIYKGILDILFEILFEEPDAEDILKTWI